MFRHSYSELKSSLEDLHESIKNSSLRGTTIYFERRLIFNFGNSPLQISDFAKAFVIWHQSSLQGKIVVRNTIFDETRLYVQQPNARVQVYLSWRTIRTFPHFALRNLQTRNIPLKGFHAFMGKNPRQPTSSPRMAQDSKKLV